MATYDRKKNVLMNTNKLLTLAWCFYDWANSSFATIITTFIFSTYFTSQVATNTIIGTAQWGYATTIAGIAIAVLSPIFGAIADGMGRRKYWLTVFTGLAIFGSAGLWFIAPNPAYALPALCLVVLSTIGYEIAIVFYNAMLPEITVPRMLGRVSGWGWGLGYLGGLLCLVIALFGFVQGKPAWLNIQQAEHVRICAVLVAIWFSIFSLPLLWLFPVQLKKELRYKTAIKNGLMQVWQTLKYLPKKKNIFRFLVARMLYTDGLNTLFAFAGIYAAGTFDMKIAEVIKFGITMNVAAGLGAISFARLDDKIGAKKTIIIALSGIIIFGSALLMTHSRPLFWILGCLVSIFIGPAQSASRSFMARLAPAHQRNEMFGLYALSGRITAYLSPWLLSITTVAFASQRVGMASLLLFLATGLGLLLTVDG